MPVAAASCIMGSSTTPSTPNFIGLPQLSEEESEGGEEQRPEGEGEDEEDEEGEYSA